MPHSLLDSVSGDLLPLKNDKQLWGNLHGCAASLLLTERIIDRKKASLIITASLADAERIYGEIKVFSRGHNSEHKVLLFPDWETLPYDNFSPHQDIVSERMRCLYMLASAKSCTVIVAAATLFQRLSPKRYVLQKSLILKKGERLSLHHFRDELIDAGYTAVDTVFQNGEFAVRGSLIDVFPMGSHCAYRVELFDDEIESLREFDPESQRTIAQVDAIQLLAGREYPMDSAGIKQFKASWHEHFPHADHHTCTMYQDLTAGIPPGGIEYFIPLFFEQTANLLSYVPDESEIYLFEGYQKSIDDYWREIENRFEQMNIDARRPLLAPSKAFFTVDQVYSLLKQHARALIHTCKLEEKAGNINFPTSAPATLTIERKAKFPLAALDNYLKLNDKPVLFCAESNGRRETLKELLASIHIHPKEFDNVAGFLNAPEKIGITVADISEGFDNKQFSLIAESQLFGTRVQQKRRRKSDHNIHEDVVKNLTELKLGAPVVHIDHGVGRYRGLETISHDGQTDEFLVLEYADEAKLYIPVSDLHLISRYTGADAEFAPWHRLGSDQWQKAKRKAAEKIRDVAAELLEIYAKRQAKQGFAHTDPVASYTAFANAFPFEETPDQESAINAVRADMLAPQPMDRLVCGDVGFGKTEVAMRAAFIAVENGKQVAILVPTTLLAQQHYENFKDRFADWPFNIDVLSRFRSGKDTQQALERLAAGETDIIVGTHKLIQNDVKFANLGLLIIDEEHRFGVRQKEALRALRAEVDVLAMTATPIPRTLNMSMSGIRDLSIISTPPAKRLSIKTFVKQHEKGVIKEAILREIMRGGQVYFLHNEVKSIERTASELAELVPDARIRTGHGQMRERELEAVMSDFYHKRFNVLVCSTIIETGIDVPSANTIIIERADKFGLAQLHQLRGRVGRSHHQAYAYLLTPDPRSMTSDAQKRLEAISEAQDLGAGFTLASHDLEIRGAGELLGDEQSGQIQTVGFTLYMDMLDRAVKALRNGKKINLEQAERGASDINLRIPALIPEDYIPDVHTRLILYKRLASTRDEEQLHNLQVEMIDRFGLLPEQTKYLFRQTHLRLVAEKMGITRIDANQHYGKLEFDKDTSVNPMALVQLVQNQPQLYRLEGANCLKFHFDKEAANDRINQVNGLIEQLQKAR